MNPDAAIYTFKNRNEFRKWLGKKYNCADGIWLVFIKGNKEFSANDALEEAICFGWIDGLMKSIDANSYRKYFTKRKSTGKWSDKNIKTFISLQERGLMTKAGIEVFNVQKKPISAINRVDINKMNIDKLKNVLMNDKEVLELFTHTAPSRQKQLAGFYCDAKTEETRKKRELKIIEALRSGNKGMLY